MIMRDLIPWRRQERAAVPGTLSHDEFGPFLALHREMNRLFDDMADRFGRGIPSVFGKAAWPSVEALETDDDVRITAELPGMDEKDIEILVKDDVLTIRGEKRAESEDASRSFSERYYGRFERLIPLPYEVDEDRAEASFENGLLTVTLPKSAKAQEKVKRIAIGAKKVAKH